MGKEIKIPITIRGLTVASSITEPFGCFDCFNVALLQEKGN